MKTSDRNKPCVCGSGIKSKRCCDTAEKRTAAKVAYEEAQQKARYERQAQLLAESKHLAERGYVRRPRMFGLMLAAAMCAGSIPPIPPARRSF